MAHALRATTALTKLTWMAARLYIDPAAADVVTGALAGHRSLRSVTLTSERGHPALLGATFAALVAADAPALQELVISHNTLGDAGLAQLVDALPRNRHLRKLDIRSNGISKRFARERLLPAVRANTGLWELHGEAELPAVAEAQELVKRRQPLHA